MKRFCLCSPSMMIPPTKRFDIFSPDQTGILFIIYTGTISCRTVYFIVVYYVIVQTRGGKGRYGRHGRRRAAAAAFRRVACIESGPRYAPESSSSSSASTVTTVATLTPSRLNDNRIYYNKVYSTTQNCTSV